MADNEKRLYRLKDLDKWQVASDDPDVRGWKLFGPDQERIGEVKELIVDPHKEKVRYLDVKVDQDLAPNSQRDETHIIVPVGLASVDTERDEVFISEMATETILNTPAYIVNKPIDIDYEERVVRHLQPESKHERDRMYENESLYSENRFYGREKYQNR